MRSMALPGSDHLCSALIASPAAWSPEKELLWLKDASWAASYDGRDSQGAFLGTGVYLFKIQSQGAGSVSSLSLKVTVLGSETALSLIAGPNPVLKGTQAMRLAWDAPGPVEIRVYDGAGGLVRIFAPETGQSSLFWDLRNSAGDPLANGVYLMALRSANRAQSRFFKIALAR